MTYAVPGEVPRSRFARFATWPLIPFLGGIVMGTLPAIAWMVANGWFLGCRDARRQTGAAVLLYGLVKLTGLTSHYLDESGLMTSLIGSFGEVLRFLASQINWLIFLATMAWLQGRQEDAAHYLAMPMLFPPVKGSRSAG
jgi:hypothetical protein